MKRKVLLLLTLLPFLLATAVFAAECEINFDLVCPDVLTDCGADFTGGLSCVVDICRDSGARSYSLNENNSLIIELQDEAYAIEAFFAARQASVGTMQFLDNTGTVLHEIQTNGDCDVAKPSAQSLRFDAPVVQINVSGNGTVFIDTIKLNPTSICAATDSLCDGVDDDCDGQIDEDGNATCNDGLYCNGVEACISGACQAGTTVDCSANDIAAVNSCSNDPDNNPLTLDSRASFTSTCDEDTDSCTAGNETITHACSLACGASCTSNADCAVGFMCATDSCSCVQDPNQTPTINLNTPVNNSLVTTKNFTVTFSTISWVIGGKNTTHLYFNIDNVPGLSFLDNLFFYNGNDSVVELNNAQTEHASYIDSTTIQFNNIPDGLHTIAAQLVDETQTVANNPESGTFIQVYVNDTKCLADSECGDNNICTADACDLETNECVNRNTQNGVLGCGTGACFREINRCSNGEEQVCTPGSPTVEICDGIDNDCNGVVDDDPVCDVSMTIYSPKEGIFSDRRLPFDIVITQEVDYISMIDHAETRPREKKLCRRCDDYGHDRPKSVSFRDGYHNVTIKAVKDQYLDFETLSFFMDSTAPRITKTEPRRDYTDGNFKVQFRETNPKTLILYYGNYSDERATSVDLDSCYEIRRGTTECMASVNVSDFDGGYIHYYFNLTDIAMSHAVSRTTELDVDLTPPQILKANTTVDGRRVTFDINVSETSTIGVIDHTDRRPRWRTLCRNCETYDRTRSYQAGEHNLTVRAVDDAGNEDTKSFLFTV